MKAYRVLVCGANYGRIYLQAMRSQGSSYEPAGILARGSANSKLVAEEYELPLYRALSEVPDDIDLACVAVGSSQPDVALGLLDRGIHVLCEHPQKRPVLLRAFKKAARRRVCLQVNAHFSDLRAPASFIESYRVRAQGENPVFIDILVADRVLWSALDIVRQSLGTLVPYRLGRARREGGFTLVTGVLSGIRAHLQIQTRDVLGDSKLADGSPGYLVDFRVCVGFASGILSLLSIAGPVLWNENLYRLWDPNRGLWRITGAGPTSPADLARERVSANLAALDRLIHQLKTHQIPLHQFPEAILEVAEVWEGLARRLESPSAHKS